MYHSFLTSYNRTEIALAHPRLCLDVLIMLLELAETRRDTISMMSTCHTLRKLGMRYLFRFPVIIFEVKDLISFCAFMKHDLSTRPSTSASSTSKCRLSTIRTRIAHVPQVKLMKTAHLKPAPPLNPTSRSGCAEHAT